MGLSFVDFADACYEVADELCITAPDMGKEMQDYFYEKFLPVYGDGSDVPVKFWVDLWLCARLNNLSFDDNLVATFLCIADAIYGTPQEWYGHQIEDCDVMGSAVRFALFGYNED